MKAVGVDSTREGASAFEVMFTQEDALEVHISLCRVTLLVADVSINDRFVQRYQFVIHKCK